MRSPYHAAHIAAILLSGRHEAEPHHVKAAVATARLILDEAEAQCLVAKPRCGLDPDPAPDPEPDSSDPATGN